MSGRWFGFSLQASLPVILEGTTSTVLLRIKRYTEFLNLKNKWIFFQTVPMILFKFSKFYRNIFTQNSFMGNFVRRGIVDFF